MLSVHDANDANNIANGGGGKQDVVRPNLTVPVDLWRGVKQAALDRGVTAQQFVVELLEDQVRPKRLKKAG